MGEIFLVGKDINYLSGVRSKLAVEGFVVDMEKDISDAVRVVHNLKRKKPGYLVVEVNNPFVHFLEIIQRTKREEDLAHLPIFAFSVLSAPEFQDKILTAGADYFFPKDELDLDSFIFSFKRIIKNKS